MKSSRQSFLRVMVYIVGIGLLLACHFTEAASAKDSCNNIRCRISNDSELSNKFDSGIHVFVENNTFQPMLDSVPEFKKNLKIIHMVSVLTGHTRSMEKNAPLSPNCVVVGNSQNLLGSHYGKIIDSHDYVFRMNSAPIASYESDVGSRTTHHIFAHNYGHNASGGEVTVRNYGANTYNILIPIHEAKNIGFNSIAKSRNYRTYGAFFTYLANALDNKESGAIADHKYEKLMHLRELPNLLVFTPDMLWYVNETWFTPPQKGDRQFASTGFLVTILAMHLCDHVDLFGFGARKDGSWGYYFSDTRARLAHHLPDFQEQFFHSLAAKGVITFYPGK